MSVPKKRQTRSAGKRRASHFALSKINLTKCPKCSKAARPHHACPNCGTYLGREVIKFKDKKKKSKEKK